MPCVWEVFYPEESSFYATKREAEHMARQDHDGVATVNMHRYEPTQEGIAKLLNHLTERTAEHPYKGL